MPKAYPSNTLMGDIEKWPDRRDDPLLPEGLFEDDPPPPAADYMRRCGLTNLRPVPEVLSEEVADSDPFADPANSLEIIETEAPLLAEDCCRPIEWVSRRFRLAAHLDDAAGVLHGPNRKRPRLEPEFPKRIGRLRRKHEALVRAWRERPPGIVSWSAGV